MKHFIPLLFFAWAYTFLSNVDAHEIPDSLNPGERIHFVQNIGQWDNPAQFAAQLNNSAVFLESHCLTMVLREQPPHDALFHHTRGHKFHAYRISFAGANNVDAMGALSSSSYDNYFIGNDTARWKSHVPNYFEVQYPNLYANINLHAYSAQNAFRYDFEILPGGDPNNIVMKYEGGVKLILLHGDISIRTSVGNIIEAAPYAYQWIDGVQRQVEANYVLHDTTVSFEIGTYDTTLPLIIDPTLHFSTYTGSSADNWGTTAAYDSYKNTYTAGLVFGIGYPTSLGAYDDSYNGNADIGIFKFDDTGSQRLYATYLGGEHADMPHSMYVNAFDELIIFGTTGSSNFPTSNDAYQTRFQGGNEIAYLCFFNADYYRDIYFPNGCDIFVSRLSADGTQLQASTFVGGSKNDGLNYRPRYNASVASVMQGNDSLYFNYGDGARGEIITDDLNNVYVGSTTFSIDFPTTQGSFQPEHRDKQEGVVFKLDYNLKNLLWSTYLGGSNDDAVYAIDTDDEYNLLVCGGTNSLNFPTTGNAFQSTYGGGSADGFIAKISYNGDQLMASTYFGSDAYDQCYFVRSGKHNEVFVYGQTKASGSTMIHNANYSTPNSGMLLARFTPQLDNRVWSTVFGTPDGRPNLSPTAFAADICNRVYAAGWGRDFVNYNGVEWRTLGTWNMATTTDAYQNSTDGQDFYVICIDNTAGHLEYATFFGELHNNTYEGGSDHVDGGTSRFDKLATLYQSVCASCGGYSGFPTTSGVWSSNNLSSNCNNALFRFNVNQDFPVAEFVVPPAGCAPYTINFHNTGRGTTYHWDFGDSTSSTLANPSHTFSVPGEYTVQLIAYMPDGCKVADTQTTVIKVLNPIPQSHDVAICTPPPLQIGVHPMHGCRYLWSGGTVSDSSIANPIVFSEGTYILTISSMFGECTEIDTFHVFFQQILDSITTLNPRCFDAVDGTAIAHVASHAQRPITFEWDGTSSLDSVLTHLAPGQHSLKIIDANGCASSINYFQIIAPERPILHKDCHSDLCNDCEGFIHLSLSGPMSYTYLWNDGDTSPLRDNLCHGTYSVIVQDSNGCQIFDTTEIQLRNSFDNVTVWADDTVIFTGETTQLHATVIDGVTYHWSPETNLSNPYAPTTSATPDASTTYTLTLTDSAQCTYEDTVHVRCIDVLCGRPNIFIPNSFTPNDDGINDQLCFRGEYITYFHIVILTRWGEVVYESNDIHNCWDGRYKDNWCPPGVYMYHCEIECEAQQRNQFKGDITLIR